MGPRGCGKLLPASRSCASPATPTLSTARNSALTARQSSPHADKTMRLWDAETGRPLGAPFNCEDHITGAVFSPDGTRIVTASVEGTARSWDAATGRQIGAPFAGHTGMVSSVAF